MTKEKWIEEDKQIDLKEKQELDQVRENRLLINNIRKRDRFNNLYSDQYSLRSNKNDNINNLILDFNKELGRKAYNKKVLNNKILDLVIKEKFYEFNGDDVEASNFFVQIGDIVREMIEEKQDISVLQIVINDKPSNPFQLNGDCDNDNKIKESIKSEQKEERFSTMKRRKYNTDYIIKNSNSRAISIYCIEGINQQTFNDNIALYNGKMIGIKVKKELLVNKKDKGQIWIIKNNKTKGFLMFREAGGEQNQYSLKDKTLIFDGYFKNKTEFTEYKKGKLAILFNKFELFKYL